VKNSFILIFTFCCNLLVDAKPNVVFILCDDLGWADLPSYGHRSVKAHGGWLVRGELKTPNIDRMVREGTLYTQFYVNSAVCSPSRAAVMTGRFPSSLGVHDYFASSELNQERGMPDFMSPEVPTVTRLMNKAGYATAHFGKWHLGSGNTAPKPEAYGIDQYNNCLRGPKGRVGSTAMIADKTIQFIETHRQEPFFINVWLYDPHSPLRPTEEMMKPYEELSPRWADNKGAMQVWYAVLTNIDHHVGRILDRLDDLGLSENTIVIFTSDNGPESGLIPFVSHYGGASSTNTGPFRWIKRSLYEGGIREPFIVRWPNVTPAGEIDDISVLSAVDLLPTLCRLTEIKIQDESPLDGEDLSMSFRGKPVTRTKLMMWENRFPVYGHVMHKSPMLAIRDDKWKLLMNTDGSRVELYDIIADPSELNNMADRYPEVVTMLSERVLEWQTLLPKGPVHADAGSNDYPWPKRK